MSSAEAAHRRTGTAAGVLELPPAYWSCRRRIGAAVGVLKLPPAYWNYRQRTGTTAGVLKQPTGILELPPAFWSSPPAYWSYRRPAYTDTAALVLKLYGKSTMEQLPEHWLRAALLLCTFLSVTNCWHPPPTVHTYWLLLLIRIIYVWIQGLTCLVGWAQLSI